MARGKRTEVQGREEDHAPVPNAVKVVAVYGRFINLETNQEIGVEPVEVELTPWIQANIDKGLLTEAV